MKRPTLAIFEKTNTGWGAFALDYPNTGGLGGTLEETRQNLLEGIGYVLEDAKEQTRILTQPPCTSVDFSEFDPDHIGNYVIEWLNIDIPAQTTEIAA